MLRGLPRQMAVVAGLLIMLGLNLGLGADPADLAGEGRTGVYARYPNAFAPHPFTFAIWLPIFAGAAALTIVQARPARRLDAVLDAAGPWAAAAFGLVGLTALTPLGLSNVVVALALGASLAALAAARPCARGADRWLVRAPLGLLAGWLVVATALNLCQLAVMLGVTIGPAVAAVLMIGAGLAGMAITRRSGEPAAVLALIWAGAGILAAHPEEVAIWLGLSGMILAIIQKNYPEGKIRQNIV
ncbi:hypothetical protein [Novosphingobium sp.]|uniref:hypothetical protein n=1 Tax=Novosphingobium sp. TaxID=1874826 RepID=UPI001E0019AF|nr:hypothetical protein [Novosphingobium sp.]MBX9662232.1 hypothetical protein [Novosphingobium sp.]